MITRRFSMDDQERFAALSGDWNPIHMDAVFARRTVAGRPVVHGIHLLIWALEQAAELGVFRQPIASLRVRFSAFVGLDQVVELRLVRQDDVEAVLRLVANGGTKTELAIRFGEVGAPSRTLDLGSEVVEIGRAAMSCDADRDEDLKGLIRSAASAEAWAESYPHAAQWICGGRLAALGASTRLVGMVCPGLHSIYLGLSLKLTSESADDAALAFVMGKPRHGLIQAQVAGGGIEGTLECLQRAAPHQQPGSAQLAGLVERDAFIGHRVLIVGGSRGLGELCAKLLAVGGAAVTITYAAGEQEALRVADDIHSTSGYCEVVQYRVGDNCGAMIEALVAPPTHAYYFATPQIAELDSCFFDVNRYENLRRFYVDGFWSLAASIHARQPDARLFYPSSIYVSERPVGYGEYAMAKATGEMLCDEIGRVLAPMQVVVERLPQLTTDQTLTSFGARGDDPLQVLLPIIRKVQARL